MMIHVLTGSPKLRYKTQGRWCTHDKPVRVRVDRNVKKKLACGSLVKYERPKPAPKLEPKKEEPVIKEEKEDKRHKKSTNKGD